MTWHPEQKEGCSDRARSWGGPRRRNVTKRPTANMTVVSTRRDFRDVNNGMVDHLP
jgi:hypothetical protein